MGPSLGEWRRSTVGASNGCRCCGAGVAMACCSPRMTGNIPEVRGHMGPLKMLMHSTNFNAMTKTLFVCACVRFHENLGSKLQADPSDWKQWNSKWILEKMQIWQFSTAFGHWYKARRSSGKRTETWAHKLSVDAELSDSFRPLDVRYSYDNVWHVLNCSLP